MTPALLARRKDCGNREDCGNNILRFEDHRRPAGISNPSLGRSRLPRAGADIRVVANLMLSAGALVASVLVLVAAFAFVATR